MATEGLRILIWGAGQHGRAVAEYAWAAGWTVVGFVDQDPRKLDTIVDAFGARICMSEAELLVRLRAHQPLPAGVDRILPAVGDNHARAAQLTELGPWVTPVLIHPSAVVSPTARIGVGTVVCPLSLVNTEARVGRGVIVNSSSVVGHNTVVGDCAHISASAALTGGVQVGARSFVGACAAIVPGVRIGADVTIGAGAVVLHELPDGVTAVGVPARPLESRKRGNEQQTHLPVASAPVRSGAAVFAGSTRK